MGTNAASKAYRGTVPLSPHVPISFVSGLFLHLSVLAGVGHNHRQERRNCKYGFGDHEGTTINTYLLLPYRPYLPGISNFLPPFADIAINLYLHPLAFYFSLLLILLPGCLVLATMRAE